MAYTYDFPRPALTVDVVVFGFTGSRIEVMLIQRRNDPFKGSWAFPGGFVDHMEDIPIAAARELEEETGLKNHHLVEFGAFGKPSRDPRGHTVSIAFWALVNKEDVDIQPGDDAADVAWFQLTSVPQLAFDHQEMLQKALRHMREYTRYRPIGLMILPEEFTIKQYRNLYAAVLDKPIDEKDFRKKIIEVDLLVELVEPFNGTEGVYSFDDREYEYLREQGFYFKI